MGWTSARTGLLTLTASLLVTGCFGFGNNDEDVPTFETDVASDATEYTLDLLVGINGIRPGSILGAHVTAFLLSQPPGAYRTALLGIEAQMRMRDPEDQQLNESYALLQDLGAALQVDIMDLLNRSTDRTETLDDYLESLVELTNRGTERAAQIDEELLITQDERRDKRREVASIRSDQSRALREEDYTTAGSLQQDLADEEQELSRLELEVDEAEHLADLFQDLTEVAQERWAAITENRAIILSGLKVVEVPGIEDIGVLREETRQERRERESEAGDTFVDPL